MPGEDILPLERLPGMETRSGTKERFRPLRELPPDAMIAPRVQDLALWSGDSREGTAAFYSQAQRLYH